MGSELLDYGYHRYLYEDNSEMPDWFLDNEKPHTQPIIPVTKQMIDEIKERWKVVNARPIKKVAEARARKRMKATRKLKKVREKANQIANDSELSHASKMREIEKLYKGELKKMNPKKVYVVTRKFKR